jgi:DNA repair protein RAD7
LGDISENVKTRLSKIVARRRQLTQETLALFIGPEETCVELFDCTLLTEDAYLQIATFSPFVQVLRLGLCGRINGTFLHISSHEKTLFVERLQRVLNHYEN